MKLSVSEVSVCVSVCVVSCPTWSQRVAWSLPVGAWEEVVVEGRGAVNTFCLRYGSAARSSGCRAAPPARNARPNAPCTREPWAESYVFIFPLVLDLSCGFVLQIFLFNVLINLMFCCCCCGVFSCWSANHLSLVHTLFQPSSKMTVNLRRF